MHITMAITYKNAGIVTISQMKGGTGKLSKLPTNSDLSL